jgi:glutamate-ammonia-ligase adenylyltransferase
MGIGSDLDLVFVFRGGERSQAEWFVKRLTERLRSTRTYETDLRLRPEGRNSPLASSIEYLKQYLEERGLLWERQSLVKARIVL